MLRAKRTPVGQRKSERGNRLNRKTGERVRRSPRPREKRQALPLGQNKVRPAFRKRGQAFLSLSEGRLP